MIHQNLFYQISLLLVMAVGLGFLGLKLRQPLIITFLTAGIILGPSCLGVVQLQGEFDIFVHIGIAILLFIVGLRLDISFIQNAGPISVIIGLAQILGTALLGTGLSLGLGFGFLPAVYIGIALTFSSTIIIVKLLSDKKEIESLPGQLTLGVLIVQDIAAIIALVALTSIGGAQTQSVSLLGATLLLALKGALVLLCIAFLSKYILPKIVFYLAASQELLVLFAIAWAISCSSLTELLGFSKEVGAFLAGISLASTDYRDAIASRLATLRDFLLLFFFINLGAQLNIATLNNQLLAAVLLTAFIVIGKPLIVFTIMGSLGYRRRTSFISGISLAQISEFSLIFLALGLSLGHIRPDLVGLITLVGVVSIFLSTYMINASEVLYPWLRSALAFFERKNPYREQADKSLVAIDRLDFILVGLGNYGRNIGKQLLKRKKSFLGVDYAPHLIDQWKQLQVPAMYGDITDPDIYEQLPLHKAKWVICTVRSKEISRLVLKELRSRGYTGKIALTSTNVADAAELESLGVHVVLRPFRDASEQAVEALTHAMALLPINIDWPIAFKELKIDATFVYSGQAVRDIPLRQNTTVSILAVSRAGKIHYDLPADFKIYPADRLLIMGPPERMRDAEELLTEVRLDDTADDTAQFCVGTFAFRECTGPVCPVVSLHGFRQKYGVTVIGIQRGEKRITTPQSDETLLTTDNIVVIGTKESIQVLAQHPDLIELSPELSVKLMRADR